MLDIFDFLLIILGLYWIIEKVWKKIEIKRYGKAIPRERDFWIGVGISVVLALILYNVAWLEVIAVIVNVVTRVIIWVWLIFTLREHSRLKRDNKELEKMLESKSETIKEYNELTDTLITELKKYQQ